MCWDAARRFPADTRSPREARHFCTEALSALLADRPERSELVDDVTLIVTELLTNSINAGADSALVTLNWHRDQLRVTVGDDAPGAPALQCASPNETHGRGLAITQSLSTAWGVETTHANRTGKAVWAELSVAPTLTDTRRCSR
jgi:anti-sigma regulatory factor (Ser/Thr protein kinase)